MTHSNIKNESPALVGVMIPALKGMAFAVGAMLILAAVFSGISLAFGDPDKVVSLLSYVTLALSAILCGIFGMASDGERRMIVPTVSGALYVLVLVVVSLFAQSVDGVPVLWRVLVYAACILLSVLGGFIAGGRQKGKSKNTKNPAALMRRRVSGKK